MKPKVIYFNPCYQHKTLNTLNPQIEELQERIIYSEQPKTFFHHQMNNSPL